MDSFKDRLLDTLKRLGSSLKVLTFIAGLIVSYLAKKGIILDPEMVNQIVLLTAALIGAQGVADFGVRKAQIEAANPKPPETVMTQINEAEPQK